MDALSFHRYNSSAYKSVQYIAVKSVQLGTDLYVVYVSFLIFIFSLCSCREVCNEILTISEVIFFLLLNEICDLSERFLFYSAFLHFTPSFIYNPPLKTHANNVRKILIHELVHSSKFN